MNRIAVGLVCLQLLVSAQDWPRFRGPNGDGVSTSTGLPTEFGPKKNLEWRVDFRRGGRRQSWSKTAST